MRLLISILYIIIGFVCTPFVAWAMFFTSLPKILKGIWQRPKKGRELLSIDDMADAVKGDVAEKPDYSPENVGIYYGNKWGRS